jgi:hypothetical protein
LCAYLRLPHKSDPDDDASAEERLQFDASREVRHTVIRVIAAHLKADAAVSWQGFNFDFTGVVFDSGSFIRVKFSGGEVDFSGTEFSGGEVEFSAAEFSGTTVSSREGKFSGGEVNFFAAKFPGGEVDFSDPRDWSSPPKFAWIDIPPQGVKLPHEEDQSPV